MAVAELIRHYGYWMVLVGTWFQDDTALVTASFLAHRGDLELPMVSLTAVLAAAVEYQFYYELTRRNQNWLASWVYRSASPMKPSAASKPSAPMKPEPIQTRLIQWLAREGSLTVVLAGFLPGFRMAVALACGASAMPRGRFTLLNIAGATLRIAVFEAAGYSSGQHREMHRFHLADEAPPIGPDAKQGANQTLDKSLQ